MLPVNNLLSVETKDGNQVVCFSLGANQTLLSKSEVRSIPFQYHRRDIWKQLYILRRIVLYPFVVFIQNECITLLVF